MSSIGNTGYTVLNEDAEMYSVIRSAEVCSVETAKKLGLLDKTRYYKGEARSQIRTFSPNVKNDAARPFAMCKETVGDGLGTEASARPLCSLLAPGLIPKPNGKCGRPDGECPPGFTWDARAKACRKPIKPVKQRRDQHCSKQWHDWFTVPNWGFQNGYEMVDKQCYEPCPPNTLPIRGKDPVTGEVRGTDSIQKCVDKMEYLGGKYGSEPDFCNLAWIKRMSVKLPNIAEEHIKKYPMFAVSGSEALEQAAKEGVIDILKETLKAPENLSPHPEITEGICARTVDTPERLSEAYNICRNIKENPSQAESKYIEEMTQTLKTVNNNVKPQALRTDILNRFKVLKQACHYTFCDDNEVQSTRAKLINSEPLCFPASEIQRVELKESDNLMAELSAGPGVYPKQKTEDAPATADRKVVQTYVKFIVNVLLTFIYVLCIGFGIWFILDAIFDFSGSFAGVMEESAEIEAGTNIEIAKKKIEVDAIVKKLSKEAKGAQ